MTGMSETDKRQLFDTLADQTKQLERLTAGVFGNEQLGIPGLIKDVSYLKEWVQKNKMRSAYVAGGITAIVFAFKGVWAVVSTYFTGAHK